MFVPCVIYCLVTLELDHLPEELELRLVLLWDMPHQNHHPNYCPNHATRMMNVYKSDRVEASFQEFVQGYFVCVQYQGSCDGLENLRSNVRLGPEKFLVQ